MEHTKKLMAMHQVQRSSHPAIKYIVALIMIAALLLADALRAQTPKQSRFSSTTLRIGIESFLRDRLEENDEFEIAGEIEEQIFNDQFVVARCDAAQESLAGSTKISLVFSKNDNILRRVYIPVRVTLKRNVPILTRSIQRGETIQLADVELKLTDVTYLNAKTAEDFVGKRLTMNVSKGSVLTQNQLTSTTTIQRGDVVSIVMQSGSVVVRTNGTALDDAQQGQSLRVRREDSSAIISGVAGENKAVFISIPQSSPSSSQK